MNITTLVRTAASALLALTAVIVTDAQENEIPRDVLGITLGNKFNPKEMSAALSRRSRDVVTKKPPTQTQITAYGQQYAGCDWEMVTMTLSSGNVFDTAIFYSHFKDLESSAPTYDGVSATLNSQYGDCTTVTQDKTGGDVRMWSTSNGMRIVLSRDTDRSITDSQYIILSLFVYDSRLL